MVQLGELVMILDLHRQRLSVTAIAGNSTSIARRSASTSPAILNRLLTSRAHPANITSIPSPPICANASLPIPR